MERTVLKMMAISALLCMGTALFAGCIAEEKTEGKVAVTPGTTPVPGERNVSPQAMNRTAGENPPVSPPAEWNMTGGQRPNPPGMDERGPRDGGFVQPSGMNGTPPAPGEAPGGMTPPVQPGS
jgi:hypothetical protein